MDQDVPEHLRGTWNATDPLPGVTDGGAWQGPSHADWLRRIGEGSKVPRQWHDASLPWIRLREDGR